MWGINMKPFMLWMHEIASTLIYRIVTRCNNYIHVHNIMQKSTVQYDDRELLLDYTLHTCILISHTPLPRSSAISECRL